MPPSFIHQFIHSPKNRAKISMMGIESISLKALCSLHATSLFVRVLSVRGVLKYFRDEQCAFCLAPFKSKRYFQLDVRLLLKNENQQVKQVQGQTTKNINSSWEEYDACMLLHLHSPLTSFSSTSRPLLLPPPQDQSALHKPLPHKFGLVARDATLIALRTQPPSLNYFEIKIERQKISFD